jgi:hypothetical protein
MRFGTIILLLVVSASLQATPADAQDAGAKCQALVSRLIAANNVVAKAMPEGPRERRCAYLSRLGLPTMERTMLLIQSEPACQGRLHFWEVERAFMRIGSARRAYQRLCNAAAMPSRARS